MKVVRSKAGSVVKYLLLFGIIRRICYDRRDIHRQRLNLDWGGIIFTKMQKLCLFGMGCVALLEMGFFYYETTLLGLPEGHLTELTKIRRLAYPVFSSWFCILALVSFFVGLKPAKSASRKTVVVFLFVLVGLNAVVFFADNFFGLHFDNGSGG